MGIHLYILTNVFFLIQNFQFWEGTPGRGLFPNSISSLGIQCRVLGVQKIHKVRCSMLGFKIEDNITI